MEGVEGVEGSGLVRARRRASAEEAAKEEAAKEKAADAVTCRPHTLQG